MNVFISREFDKYYAVSPITLVDIGARQGLQRNWLPAEKHLIKIFVEPEQSGFKNLIENVDERTTLLNVALYKERRQIDFYVCRKPNVSSIYPPHKEFLDRFPRPERFDVVAINKVQAETLDGVLKSKGNLQSPSVDFIKIDTQGSELDIIKGSTEVMHSGVIGFEVEVEFAEMYKGQPLFDDVHSVLREHGFDLIDFVRTVHWQKRQLFGKGQLIYADALYFRNPDLFAQEVSKLDSSATKIRVLKYMSLCYLYKKFDRVQTLFEMFTELFTDREKQLITFAQRKSYLVYLIPSWISYILNSSQMKGILPS